MREKSLFLASNMRQSDKKRFFFFLRRKGKPECEECSLIILRASARFTFYSFSHRRTIKGRKMLGDARMGGGWVEVVSGMSPQILTAVHDFDFDARRSFDSLTLIGRERHLLVQGNQSPVHSRNRNQLPENKRVVSLGGCVITRTRIVITSYLISPKSDAKPVSLRLSA